MYGIIVATRLIRTITCYMLAVVCRTHLLWQIAGTKDEQSWTRRMHQKQGMYATHRYTHWVYWPLNVCKCRVKAVIATISVPVFGLSEGIDSTQRKIERKGIDSTLV